MRPVLLSDVCAAARAVMRCPVRDRFAFAEGLLRKAEAADLHRTETGNLHPRWGNGTLLAAARAFPIGAERGFDDPDYLDAFAMVVLALLARQNAGLVSWDNITTSI